MLRVLADLAGEHYLAIEKSGRRNLYRVHQARPLRRPELQGVSVERFLEALRDESAAT